MYVKQRGKPSTTGFKHPTQEMFAMMMKMIVEEMYVGVNVNDGMQLNCCSYFGSGGISKRGGTKFIKRIHATDEIEAAMGL